MISNTATWVYAPEIPNAHYLISQILVPEIAQLFDFYYTRTFIVVLHAISIVFHVLHSHTCAICGYETFFSCFLKVVLKIGLEKVGRRESKVAKKFKKVLIAHFMPVG